MAYTRVNWQNSPSHATPLSAENLNVMDAGIASLDDDVSDVKEELENISGISEEVKVALLQIASKVAYIDEHGQDYYDDLYEALYAVSSISINARSISLTTIGGTSQLTATTVPAGATVTWTSSDESVVTVSDSGLVTSTGYGSATITATAGSKSATCSVMVAQAVLVSISATYTPSGTVYDSDTLDSLKSDLVVTALWDNGISSEVPSSDYTLSGTLETGTSTITVSYGSKETTFAVTVVGLVSISAVYTQGGNVYEDTNLDDLKADLVVTANYTDSSTQTITDYTLSGTLAVGISTITVSYDGMSTTFTVTVSTAPIAPYYALPEAVTFTGSNVYKTGVKLNSLIADGAASMFIDFSDTGETGVSDGRVAWNIGIYSSSYTGVHISGGSSNSGFYNFIPVTAQNTSAYYINTTFGSSCNVKMMFVWELVQSVYNWTVYTVVNGVFAGKYSGSLSSFSVGADSPLVLGGQTTNSDVTSFNNYWKGTVNALNVYDSAVSEDDVFTMLGISSTVSYDLSSETTFDGSSDYIDTGLKPRLDIRTPYTIMADFTPDTQTFVDGSNTLADLYSVGNVGSGADAHYLDILNNANYRIFGGVKNAQNITFTSGQRTKIVIKKDASNNLTYYVKVSGSETVTGTLSSITGDRITTNLFIGAALKSNAMSRFFKGTIHDIKVHLAEVSDDDISAYLS